MHKAFVVEGPKLVNDMLLNGNVALKIFTTDISFIDMSNNEPETILVSELELKKISFLKTPHKVLAVFQIVENQPTEEHPSEGWGVALDYIQDPGNLGTILRTMNWLGIKHAYCSLDTVDVYNPKTVQASMGAIGSIKIKYLNLSNYLTEQKVPVYASVMDGIDFRESSLKPGILLFGNEGKGIRDELLELSTEKITIPKMGKGESLNVAIAVSIIGSYVTLK